jgi:peptidyl-prolyl cis-trans isomerase D
MLDGLRIMSKNVFGRTILALFAGLIVVGFGFFGIRDVFTNFRANQLATIGNAEIGVAEYRAEYQNELQRLQRQARRAVTNDEARALGLDRQVLSRLMTGAALDQAALSLGLSLSDAEIAKTIKAEKMFAGLDGKFDQARFDELLRDNGYTEASYLREQRGTLLRQQLGAAINGGFKVPQVMLEAINRFNAETRKAVYFILPAPDSASLPAPGAEAIQSFYDMRKDAYREPEYRKAVTLTVAPAEIAKSLVLGDEAARKIYDRDAAQKYGAPEKRAVTQLTFPTQAEADKAKQRIDAGESFQAVAADKSSGGVIADLGVVTKAAIFDKAVADAAFHAPVPGVAGPAPGKFGVVLVDVGEITPGTAQSFESVKDQIKADLAQSRAKSEVQTLHEKIEDLRSSGKTLTQAAQEVGLKVETYVTDASGAGRQGSIPALASAPELLKAIFASDVGVDNDSVSRKDGGYAWFEVAAIEPSRQKPLDEVKDQVTQGLKDGEAQKALAAKANDLARQIDSGADIAALASANGVAVSQVSGVRRAGAAGITESASTEIFALPVGAAGVALADKGGRYVLKVTETATPPLDAQDPALARALPQLEAAMADDLLVQYVSGLQSQLGMRINQTALSAALGSEAP